MKKGSIGAIAIALLVLFMGLGIYFGISYNTLVQKEERVRSAWAQVESNIQRKADLLPQLYSLVRRYMEHEKEIYEEVTRLRTRTAQTPSLDPQKARQLKKSLDTLSARLFAVAERYPELRSSEQFLQLQSQIEGSENRINITRMAYNEAVREYNIYLRSFPARLVGHMAGFAPKPYFRSDKKEKGRL